MYVIFIQYSILYFRMRGQAENVPELLMYTVLYQETWEVWTLSNNYDCGWVNVILCALNLIVHVLIVLNMLRYWSLKIDNPFRRLTAKYFNTYISIYILWLSVNLSYSKIFTMRRLTCFLDCCMFFTCFLIHLHLFPLVVIFILCLFNHQLEMDAGLSDPTFKISQQHNINTSCLTYTCIPGWIFYCCLL